MLKRISGTLPIAGILIFLLLYFYAASLYSTATTLDLTSHGYEHLHNYWCELYVPFTYTGQPNPGRPYAMAATLILTTSLIFFFLSVTALFVEFIWLAIVVRLAGPLSMLAASLIFTPFHDLVITLGVPLGALALLAICIALIRKREWLLVALAIIAITDCMSDYTLWKLGRLHYYQPMIQKSAFALFFLWVLATAYRVLAYHNSLSQNAALSPRSA